MYGSVVKHKHEVFGKFVEWKSLVEKSSGYKVKKLCEPTTEVNIHPLSSKEGRH